MSQLTTKISLRIARYLERAKLIERDAENCYLADDALGDNEMTKHQGHVWTLPWLQEVIYLLTKLG